MSTRLGAQAIGQIRELRKRLRAEALALTAAARTVTPATAEAIAFKGRKAADASWSKVMAVMPAPYWVGPYRRLALWRTLRPLGPMLRQGDVMVGDGAVAVTAVMLGRTPAGAGLLEDFWAFAATDHALGRVLERSMFRADPVAAMLEAHDAVLIAPLEIATVLDVGASWAVPGGPGAFLCTLRQTADGDGPESTMLTAETWISTDELRPEQAAQVAAIRFKAPGATLGAAWFLPPVLRGMVVS